MVSATLTAKGQITIPSGIRAEFGLSKGDRVVFERVQDGYLMSPSPRGVERLAGFFGPFQGDPVTVEQMNRDVVTAATS